MPSEAGAFASATLGVRLEGKSRVYGAASVNGTIYVPAAKLMVDGGKRTGQTSPWTVVASKGLAVNQSTDLVINATYASSDVPVPIGVGTKVGSTRLTR